MPKRDEGYEISTLPCHMHVYRWIVTNVLLKLSENV